MIVKYRSETAKFIGILLNDIIINATLIIDRTPGVFYAHQYKQEISDGFKVTYIGDGSCVKIKGIIFSLTNQNMYINLLNEEMFVCMNNILLYASDYVNHGRRVYVPHTSKRLVLVVCGRYKYLVDKRKKLIHGLLWPGNNFPAEVGAIEYDENEGKIFIGEMGVMLSDCCQYGEDYEAKCKIITKEKIKESVEERINTIQCMRKLTNMAGHLFIDE